MNTTTTLAQELSATISTVRNAFAVALARLAHKWVTTHDEHEKSQIDRAIQQLHVVPVSGRYKVYCDYETPMGARFEFVGETTDLDYARDLQAIVQRKLLQAIVTVHDQHGDSI